MQVLRQHRYAAQKCSGAVVTTCAASTIQQQQHCRAAQCNLSSYEVHLSKQQLIEQQQHVTVGQQQAQRLKTQSHIQSQHRQDLSVWSGLSAWRSKGVDLGRGWGSKNRADPSIPAAGAAEAEHIPLPGSLVDVALLVLNTADPNLKAALAHRGWKAYSAGEICLHPEDAAAAAAGAITSASSRQHSTCHPTADRSSFLQPQQQHIQHQELENPTREQHQQQLCQLQQQCQGPPDRPARPSNPQLVVPKLVPSPKDSQLPLSAHLLHNLAHIELNAIDLALDTVARFSHLRLPDGEWDQHVT